MKHERGMKELLGQNGTSGGGIRTADKLFIQASLSMGITPQREVEEKTLKKKGGGGGKGRVEVQEVACDERGGGEVKCFVSIFFFFKHLLSSTPRYSTEDDRDTD